MMLWQRKLRYRFRTAKPVRRGGIYRRRGIRCLCLGLLAFACVWGFFRIEGRIGALAQQAAISKLNGTITKDVNRVVTEVLEEEEVDTQSLMVKQQDEAGKVLSMTTDYNAVNRMKSALAIKIQQSLDKLNTVETTVPVGMLFSDTFLTGVGFKVPVKVFATNAIQVEFKDGVSSAGINQSRYQLMVEITVPARVAGVFRYEDTQVVTQIPIAETVLVGDVPQMYVNR